MTIFLFTFYLQCDPIRGLGFRRGSYKCVCKDSFYFPNVTAKHRYFFGTDVEHEYEKAKRVSMFLSITGLNSFSAIPTKRKINYLHFKAHNPDTFNKN